MSVTSRVSSRPTSAVTAASSLARPTSTGSGTGPAVGSGTLGGARAGSCSRIRRSRARRSGDGSSPSSSQRRARVAVGVERVCLPAGAVQARGSAGRGAAHDADVRRRAPRSRPREASCRPSFLSRSIRRSKVASRSVEPRRLRGRERRVRDVRERRPAPQRERLSKLLRDRPGEVREPLDVELGGLDPDGYPGAFVTIRSAPNAPRRAWDVHLEGVLGARGRRLAPDPVDEAVGQTTRLRSRRSRARSARGRGPPRATGNPSSPITSSGPNSRNSTPQVPFSPFLSRARTAC